MLKLILKFGAPCILNFGALKNFLRKVHASRALLVIRACQKQKFVLTQ